MCIVRICRVEFWGIGGIFFLAFPRWELILDMFQYTLNFHAFSDVSCISSSLVYWHSLYWISRPNKQYLKPYFDRIASV